MIKNIIIGVLAVALLVYGSLSLFAPKLGIGEVTGPQHYTVEHFQQGFYVGTGRQLSIDNAGLLTTSGGITNTGAFTIGSGGTSINLYKCYSNATFDPGSVSSSTASASVAFLTPNASAGDIVLVSLDTVTSTELWFVEGKVTAGSGTAGASSTLYLWGGGGDAINLSTTTAKLCIIN